MGMTQAGMILGTAAYMAPEQARGKESVDKRADIWAFGVVLYELLTGKRLFQGEDAGEILAKVIRDEPDLSDVPTQLTPLLKRCLERSEEAPAGYRRHGVAASKCPHSGFTNRDVAARKCPGSRQRCWPLSR